MLLKALLVLGIPVAAAFAGGKGLIWLKGEIPARDPSPLDGRCGGYTAEDVATYWDQLKAGTDLLPLERKFLVADLAYPLLYGGGLIVALLIAWHVLDRAFPVAWLLAPVCILMVADWTENLVQLHLLSSFVKGVALDDQWVKVASTATRVKIAFIVVCATVLIGATVATATRASPAV